MNHSEYEKVELITPYGGTLIDLLTPHEDRQQAFSYSTSLPSIQLTKRQVCDLEMMAIGGFSPLDRFMSEADHRSVVDEMRLADGTVFPITVGLQTERPDIVSLGSDVTLRDERNNVLAIMRVDEIYEPDLEAEMQAVAGTQDEKHPLVAEMGRWGKYNISGKLTVLSLPKYFDSLDLRLIPEQTRAELAMLGRSNVVAFQTRNPLHNAHIELTREAMNQIDATLLLHPAVGMTKDGDIDHFTRVRSYRAIARAAYPQGRAVLALLPLAMRMAGPREAVWHAIIRRNFGADHFIVGRDHASPGVDYAGRPFYGPNDARELAYSLSDEIGTTIMSFDEFVYLADEDRYAEKGKIEKGAKTFALSGTQVREEYLDKGKMLPYWFTRPEVAEILAESYPPRDRQGVCLWFTGLSGSGKSTTAEIVSTMLLELGRQVTILDGDVVRTHLSKGLGFSAEDRETNIRRIGFVASEIARHGGFVICAAVSPYQKTRNEVRQMFRGGQFIEIFVNTPLSVCEERDEKGMYAKARRGEIRNFTGIDDPYEEPLIPDITLNTVAVSAVDNARMITDLIITRGFIKNPSPNAAEVAGDQV
jgi:sulfate adenylyltransferase